MNHAENFPGSIFFNSLEKEAETQWNVQKAMISMKKGEE